jgi:hypothetical protein
MGRESKNSQKFLTLITNDFDSSTSLGKKKKKKSMIIND